MAYAGQDVISGNLGTFWRGADNNVWVAGSDGTNKAGTWQPSTRDYWTNMGYKQTADPVTPIFPGTAPTGKDGVYDGYSTKNTSTPSYDPNDLAYLDSQLGRYQGLLGDVDTFQNQALSKLGDSYNSAVNKANTSHSRAVRGFDTKQYEDERGKERSIGKVDDNAYNLNRSLRMILGLAGGSGSSAFKYAAPNAVAKAASSERGDVLGDYSDNVNRLKTAREDTKEDYESLLNELSTNKKAKEGELRTGYAQERQSINDMLAQIAAEKASLIGGNPLDATAPYRTAYDSLQNQIKGYGNQYRTAVDQRELSVAPVSLKDYVVDRQALNANKQFGQANSSPYAQFLNRQREEDERVI